MAWWAFGAPVALARRLPHFSRHARPPRVEASALRRLNAILVLALSVAVVALQPLWRTADPLTGPAGLLRDAPGGLAQALAVEADSTDRVVVPQPWASWFEWSAPDRLVMVDSRIELFDEATWTDYLAIADAGPDALDMLGRIGATVVVVEPGSSRRWASRSGHPGPAGAWRTRTPTGRCSHWPSERPLGLNERRYSFELAQYRSAKPGRPPRLATFVPKPRTASPIWSGPPKSRSIWLS